MDIIFAEQMQIKKRNLNKQELDLNLRKAARIFKFLYEFMPFVAKLTLIQTKKANSFHRNAVKLSQGQLIFNP